MFKFQHVRGGINADKVARMHTKSVVGVVPTSSRLSENEHMSQVFNKRVTPSHHHPQSPTAFLFSSLSSLPKSFPLGPLGGEARGGEGCGRGGGASHQPRSSKSSMCHSVSGVLLWLCACLNNIVNLTRL